MKKLLLFSLMLYLFQLSFSQIGIVGKIQIIPATPLASDSVKILAITGYHDFIFLFDTNLIVVDDTVYIQACHGYAWSSTHPPSKDSFQYNLGILHSGLWVVRYIAYGTPAADSSCMNYNLTDTIFKSFIVGSAAINELQSSPFTISPNPTPGPIKITPPLNAAGNYSIDITNLLGQTVYKGYPNNNQIDVANLASGIYLLNLTINGSHQAAKFVKQ